MKCEDFEKEIDAYLDGDLSINESKAFKNHIVNCWRCQKELMSVEKCIRLMRKFTISKNPPVSIKKTVFEKCGCIDLKDMSYCNPPAKE
jgi:hypothetical protein